ncbi:MAG: PEP-CTERM sorting domain-containing protein [Terriglobales bacterium]
MNVDTKEKSGRRRRSWYRRRLRIQRALVAGSLVTLLLGACWQNLARHLSLPYVHSSDVLPSSWTRPNSHKDSATAAAHSAKTKKYVARIPGVYPYSVVPGGIKDPSDLRSKALRDYVVRQHYSHFDFEHARLVQATEAREVYLSYRIRDTVYWTRKKVRLHPGEMLLTDGKITARARCGNQISDTAKPEVSEEEPADDVLDQPVAELDSGPSWPNRPALPANSLPTGAPAAPPFNANGFYFAYVPFGVPLPSGYCSPDDQSIHCHHKRPKPPTVPEPSTIVLLVSGLGLIGWRYRGIARPFAA